VSWLGGNGGSQCRRGAGVGPIAFEQQLRSPKPTLTPTPNPHPAPTRLEEMNEKRASMIGKLKSVEKDVEALAAKKDVAEAYLGKQVGGSRREAGREAGDRGRCPPGRAAGGAAPTLAALPATPMSERLRPRAPPCLPPPGRAPQQPDAGQQAAHAQDRGGGMPARGGLLGIGVPPARAWPAPQQQRLPAPAFLLPPTFPIRTPPLKPAPRTPAPHVPRPRQREASDVEAKSAEFAARLEHEKAKLEAYGGELEAVDKAHAGEAGGGAGQGGSGRAMAWAGRRAAGVLVA
jgi:hypothetical protein